VGKNTSVKDALKNEGLILKIKDFIEAFFFENKKASSCRNFVNTFLSIMFIILRRLYAININPTSALARFVPFW
jgi:hypothetical protein